MKQWALLLLMTMVLGMMIFSGVALAKNIRGSFGPDKLIGTAKVDEIYGLGGNDKVHGKGGNDRIDGGFGSDSLFGGAGNDLISAADRYEDHITCGSGIDTVYIDEFDIVGKDCEPAP
jgi:Ca2+-binding RTX toxin-like protein